MMAATRVREYPVKMKLQYFVGSCILAVGLLLKAGAPVPAMVMGIVLAALVYWLRQRGSVSK
jgi:hypothetical protein